MSAPLACLPPELYTAILDHLPQTLLQQTVLSLTRALPHSPIPLYHLFQRIRLTHSSQAIQLYNRLRCASSTPSTPNPASAWIREFSVEAWTIDAYVVINLVRLMSNLTALSLCIGPNNFAPEHLDEMFARGIPELKYLSLRFRPYVQRAAYDQFLKGAYFDSALINLSKLPSSGIQSVSVIQEPLQPSLARKLSFAQPLVFFRLDSFSSLVSSPFLSSLTALRLCIPSRQITRFTTLTLSVPALEFLDLSTCNILDTEVDALFVRFVKLKHLILDECVVVKGDLREGAWRELGKRSALVGCRRAKEREKCLSAWLDANRSSTNRQTEAEDINIQTDIRKPRRGRRGLATASISLRASPPKESVPLPAISIPKIRILPPVPSLLSFATTIGTMMPPDKYPLVRAEFEQGWADGLTQLVATRMRLRQSSMNGVRIMRFSGEMAWDGPEGLENVERDDEAYGIADDIWKAPVLCLVGPGRGEHHPEGCGHAVGWEIWKEGYNLN